MTRLERLLSLVGRRPAVRIADGPAAGMRMALHGWMAEPYERGDYEPDVAAALERLVRPGAVCADLGAHAGYFTLVMAALSAPGGRVIAFEAAPDNAERVRRAVELNGLEGRVTVENAAAGDGRESLRLYPGRGGGATEWTTLREFAEREGAEVDEARAVEVPNVALDDRLGPGSRLDVVKIDIEGGEALAVPGMRRVLAEARPAIVLEFHREVGWPAIPALLEADYRFATLAGEPLPAPRRIEDVPYQVVAMAG